MRCDVLSDLERLVSAMPDDELHDFRTMHRTYKDRIMASPWWSKLRESRSRNATTMADTANLTTIVFRVYKSCILWDCLLSS